jgi:DNA-binding MarR family transcriptional regulator
MMTPASTSRASTPRARTSRTATARTGAGSSGAAAATDRLRALDRALLEVRRLVNRPGYRRRLLGPLGRRIELSTVRVLHAVDQADSPPSIGDVATTLAIDPSTASRLVDQRVLEGLLERSPDPDDRRRAVLRITTAGHHLLAELTDSRLMMLEDVTAGWSATDVRMLEQLLARLVAGFRTLEDDRA